MRDQIGKIGKEVRGRVFVLRDGNGDSKEDTLIQHLPDRCG